jgi:hypothetical protein
MAMTEGYYNLCREEPHVITFKRVEGGYLVDHLPQTLWVDGGILQVSDRKIVQFVGGDVLHVSALNAVADYKLVHVSPDTGLRIYELLAGLYI